MAEMKTECLKEACRIEEDALLSGKAHFVAAHRWGYVHLWIGIPATAIAAVAGVTALQNHPVIGGVLAIVVAALSALSTFLNPSGRQNAHLLAGNQYLALRNSARIFHRLEAVDQAPAAELKAALQKLAERRDSLNTGSPQVSTWAFNRARAGIASGEAQYEIDKAPASTSK